MAGISLGAIEPTFPTSSVAARRRACRESGDTADLATCLTCDGSGQIRAAFATTFKPCPACARAAAVPRSLGLQGHGTSPAAPSSRTRRNHGVFLLGNELASVYSSRREGDGNGVMVTVGEGSLILSGSMTPTQARSMARALMAAAYASEAVQVRAGARLVAEGGAA